MAVFKSPLEQADSILKRPTATTPEQMEKLQKAAIKKFGTTDKFKDAFYLLPGGEMLSGTGGQKWGRVYDHRDVNEIYGDEGIDLDDDAAGNTTNMLDFMRGGNIRLIPETNAIDLMKAPTSQQLRAIYNMYRQGALEGIQISNPSDKYGQQLDYLEDIQNEQQIRNLFKKHYDYL